MHRTLDKDIRVKETVAYILGTSRGFPPKVSLHEMVNAILYKLKTGVQSYQLPVNTLLDDIALRWQSVYHHYRKWCKCWFWKDCWMKFVNRHRVLLVVLERSHTAVKGGGANMGSRGRKKIKTTNCQYLTDMQGLPLAMSQPVTGNHNDLYAIELQFEIFTAILEEEEICVGGLFLKADEG